MYNIIIYYISYNILSDWQGLLHEVPVIEEGSSTRIVLATFIGYSENDAEIFVWS